MIYTGYELDVAKTEMKEHHQRAVREKQIQKLKENRRGNSSLWQKLANLFRRSNLKSTYVPLHISDEQK